MPPKKGRQSLNPRQEEEEPKDAPNKPPTSKLKCEGCTKEIKELVKGVPKNFCSQRCLSGYKREEIDIFVYTTHTDKLELVPWMNSGAHDKPQGTPENTIKISSLVGFLYMACSTSLVQKLLIYTKELDKQVFTIDEFFKDLDPKTDELNFSCSKSLKLLRNIFGIIMGKSKKHGDNGLIESLSFAKTLMNRIHSQNEDHWSENTNPTSQSILSNCIYNFDKLTDPSIRLLNFLTFLTVYSWNISFDKLDHTLDWVYDFTSDWTNMPVSILLDQLVGFVEPQNTDPHRKFSNSLSILNIEKREKIHEQTVKIIFEVADGEEDVKLVTLDLVFLRGDQGVEQITFIRLRRQLQAKFQFGYDFLFLSYTEVIKGDKFTPSISVHMDTDLLTDVIKDKSTSTVIYLSKIITEPKDLKFPNNERISRNPVLIDTYCLIDLHYNGQNPIRTVAFKSFYNVSKSNIGRAQFGKIFKPDFTSPVTFNPTNKNRVYIGTVPSFQGSFESGALATPVFNNQASKFIIYPKSDKKTYYFEYEFDEVLESYCNLKVLLKIISEELYGPRYLLLRNQTQNLPASVKNTLLQTIKDNSFLLSKRPSNSTLVLKSVINTFPNHQGKQECMINSNDLERLYDLNAAINNRQGKKAKIFSSFHGESEYNWNHFDRVNISHLLYELSSPAKSK